MTTYNTGNPIGSVDVRDLYDNSENLDNFTNGPLDAYTDRLGVSRQSLQGIRNASQYVDIGPYGPGLLLTSRNQVFSYLGEFYAPGPSITLPYTTTGVGAAEIANFRSVGDAILRSDLADDADPSNGASLIGYKSRTVSEVLGEHASPFDYGAAGDGVSDDTAALAAAFSSGKTVRLGQDGVTYKVTGTLTVPAGAKITNDGAVINFTQAGVSALNIAGSDIEIDGVKLVGPNATDTYAANSSGITGTGLVSAYLINVVIKNCDIRNFGQSGIFLNYLAAGVIENNTIENVGYSGVHILSGFDCKVHGNKIVRCYPGSGAGVVGSSAAYGISATRNASLSAVAAPPSKNVLVTNNIVRNVTTWEGLDTHGGDGITFAGNIVENCWVAANVIHADGGGSIVPALKVVFSNNTFIAGNEPGAAVYVKPSSGTVVGDCGSVSVVDNVIYRHGTFSTALSSQGAIYAEQATSGLIITGNQFYECKYNGIRIYDYCYGVVISDNVFKDMLTISSVNRAISLDTANNSTVIFGNAFIRTSGSFDAIYIGFTTAKVAVSADNLYFGTIDKFPGAIPSDGTQRRSFVAKANINGSTGVVRSAIGMTSARTGAGAYTITLDEPMKTVNYVPLVSSNQPITMVTAILSTTQFTIVTQSSVGVPADAGLILVGVGME